MYMWSLTKRAALIYYRVNLVAIYAALTVAAFMLHPLLAAPTALLLTFAAVLVWTPEIR
jgi:hypothetical protein